MRDMAVVQTLALPSNIRLCSPRNHLITSASLNPNYDIRLFSSTSETTKNIRRFSTHGGIKCSVDYNNSNSSNNGDDDRLEIPRYPRPSEIPWQKEIVNTLHLIGYVGTDVQIRYYPEGRTLAFCRLNFKTSFTEVAGIMLLFWGELAHVAVQHLAKGNQIYISGRLHAQIVDTDDGKEQGFFKVNVKQLNFIERDHSVDGDSNSGTPGRKFNSNYGEKNSGSLEELWQAFFANPADWWDNRKKKRNPKSPDFKHKHTGEALWISGRYNPPWVRSQLEILDSRMEAFQDQNQNDGMKVDFGAGDNYSTL